MDSPDPRLLDRQRGAIVGLAVGDALGAAVEFLTPGTFPPVTDFRAGGPHGLAPGEWTDDTSMALALADSLASVGWDLNDQAQRYVAWWRRGKYSVTGACFDIGITTRAALARFEQGHDVRSAADPSPRASGNGSIMRLAPVPVRYASHFPDELDLLIERCVESSLPTHSSPQCLSACGYLGVILAAMIRGLPREKVLAPDWPPLLRLQATYPLHPEVAEIAAGSFRQKKPPAIQGSGYVVRSLEAALWAFHDAADYREAVLRAVNLGDDADTTGAVCGQLAGAHFGESGIPAAWKEQLGGDALIDGVVSRLFAK